MTSPLLVNAIAHAEACLSQIWLRMIKLELTELIVFWCCNTEQKEPIYLPWKVYFHGSLTFQRGQPPDKCHICGLCREQYPASQAQWDGDLSKPELEFHLNIFVCSESIDWLRHIVGHVWVYGWCVNVGVCVGEKERKMQLFLRLLLLDQSNGPYFTVNANTHLSPHLCTNSYTASTQDSHN